MSLLYLDVSDRDRGLAQKIFERQVPPGSRLAENYSDYHRRVALRDILYHLKYLELALQYQAPEVFLDFSYWVLDLMNARMQDIPFERVKKRMVMHFQTMMDVLAEEYDEQAFTAAKRILQQVMTATQAAEETRWESDFAAGPYAETRARYLQCLLDNDRMGASSVVNQAMDSGVPLEDIYMEVLQETMREVGNRWQKNTLTVDKEHCCTAITQAVMAELYSRAVSPQPRYGTIAACCVDSELHDTGIRMICDLFALRGFTSVYLGAAVPTDAIVHALREYKPDLLALSVTMFPYVAVGREVIEAIRSQKEFDAVTIAVGGRAIAAAPNLTEQWGVMTAANAAALLKWAEAAFGCVGSAGSTE